jgi:hypothetical protein
MTLEEQFETLTLKDLEDFITNKQEEHLQLDFKTVKHASLNSTDDKKNFAEALSGFANSSGGLIVWGINARKNADGIDCADSKKEIDNLPQFLSRLNALTGEAVNPLVDGVRHRGISTNGDSGFAVTIVSESEITPHMAKCGQQRYYKRSGDSFYQMEHYDLEDMFGRRKKAKLHVTTRIVRKRIQMGEAEFLIMVELRNSGKGTAKAPFLDLTLPQELKVNRYGIDGNGNFDIPRIATYHNLGRERFGGNSNVVIHPNTYREVGMLELKIPNLEPYPDIVFEYEATSEDSILVKGVVTIQGEELSERTRG